MIPHKNDGGLFPFCNNFLTLFGLMVLNDEERKIEAEMAEDEDQEDKELDTDEDFDDSPDTDFDDDFSGDDDEEDE